MTAGARQAPCKRRRRTSERALVRCTCAVERARSEARRCALCRFVAAGVSERDRRAHTLLVARVRPQRRQDVLAGGRHALEPLRASRGRACDSARGARTRSAAPRRGRAGASGLQGRAAGGRGGAGQRGAGERRKGARGGSAGCAPSERKNACAVSARRRSEGVSGALVADRKADLNARVATLRRKSSRERYRFLRTPELDWARSSRGYPCAAAHQTLMLTRVFCRLKS